MLGQTAYDITLPLGANTLRYPGDPPPRLTRECDIGHGDKLTVSELTLNLHVGTHVDAPSHFLADGASLDGLEFSRYWGDADVIELGDTNVVREEHLRHLPIRADARVLLRTKNSGYLHDRDFREDHCYLTQDAAAYLCRLKVPAFGFDYYSVDRYGDADLPVHTCFASAGIPVYVCLDLGRVPTGSYQFSGLPLSLVDSEASPVRAVLWRQAPGR